MPAAVMEHDLTYYDIGHSHDQPYALWAWTKGKFLVSPIFPKTENRGHGGYFSGSSHVSFGDLSTYAGRYEKETGRVSICVPTAAKFREIPKVLENHLFDAFGPEITFYRFDG
jgi:hypothetical protein